MASSTQHPSTCLRFPPCAAPLRASARLAALLVLAGAALLCAAGCSDGCWDPFDPCKPKLILDEHCAETGACSVDGAPIESLDAAWLARGQTLAVPLAGIDWTRANRRDLFLMYWSGGKNRSPLDTWPDPDQARVVVDGELGSCLGCGSGSASSADRWHAWYRWDAWPTSPQLLTVSYADGTAEPIYVSMFFGNYECEIAMGRQDCQE